MRTTIAIGSLFTLLSLPVVAQDGGKSQLKFTDISVTTGLQSNFGRNGTDNFLLNAASAAPFIPTNLDLYQNNDVYYNYGSGAFEVMAGFAWKNSAEYGGKVQKRLRFGLSYSQPVLMSSTYYREDTSPYDTLVSSRTGQEYYVDSVFNSFYGLNYDVNMLALNTSFLWSTDDAARLSCYGGVNLSFNLNFSNRINVSRHDYGYLRYVDSGFPYYGEEIENFEHQSESYKQPVSFGLGFYSPIGVDWRLGKQGKGFNDVHLFSEIRPGVSFNNVPGYDFLAQFRSSIHLGIRFSV